MLLRRPWISFATVLTLALGIAASTAIFSLADALLLRALPFAEPDRLVQVQRAFGGIPIPSVSARQFNYWRERATSFERMIAYSWMTEGLALEHDGRPARLEGCRVMAGFFEMFGARPLLGRTFTAEEDRPGGPPAVVLSHRLWQRRFGGEREIVGRKLRFNGEPHTVIGVMAPEFRYPVAADVWLPLQLDRGSADRLATLTVTARLADGVTPRRAQAAMAPVERDYVRLFGELDRQESLVVQPLKDHLYGSLKMPLLLLAGCVALVLLIACANVANLQLARAVDRRHELATRLALGASAPRLLRQLLTESLVLALLGGAVGFALSRWFFRPLLAVLPSDVQRFHEVELGVMALVFTLAVVGLVTLVTGLAPGLAVRKLPVISTIKEAGGRVSAGRAQQYSRLLLVVSEVALTVVAMVLAALLVKNYLNMSRVDSGVDPDGVMTVRVALPAASYGTGQAWQKLSERLLPELRRLPGVEAAATTSLIPMQGGPSITYLIEGRDPEEPSGFGDGRVVAASPGYFEVLGVGLRSGRVFDARDHGAAERVAIINDKARRELWPGEDPVGQRIVLGPPILPDLGDPTPRTIVGVVDDVHEDGFGFLPPRMVYLSFAQTPDRLAARLAEALPMALLIKSSSLPADLTEQVQQAVWDVDASLPVFAPAMLDDVLAGSLRPDRLLMNLVGMFAVVAVVLAAVGIYGVLAYLVGRRKGEIGVRMAMGATRLRIVALVVRQGMTLVLLGIAVGLLVAASLSRTIGSLMIIRPLDALTYTLVPLALIAIALAAIAVPAYRASQVRPSEALRCQ